MRSLFAFLLVMGLVGCSSDPARGPVELVDAPPTDEVSTLLVSAIASAKQAGKHLVIYVGAEWCEPCRAFHDAAKAGELDKVLGDVRFVVFDLDRDRERLDAAGYHSQLVPMFAIPGPDGRASGLQTDGIKKNGEGPLHQLVPRIRALLPAS